MTALALSVLLALVSAVCYAAGAILQERVAATAPQGATAPLRRRGWWGAVSLNGAGAVLHVLALAYGPLSVVQPLGALTIVFALPMAAVFVRRKVGAAGWRGALLATAGLAGLLSLTGSAPAEALADGEWIAVGAVTVGAIALLAAVARGVRRPAVRGVLLATAAGTAFGISSVFTKNVALSWSWESWTGDALPSLVMIGVLSGAGVLLSQASYRGTGLAAPLATATVVNPVVATAVGLTALGEHFRHGAAGAATAVLAAAVAGAGLVLLAAHGAREAAGTTDEGGAGAPGAARCTGADAGDAEPAGAHGTRERTADAGRSSGPAGGATAAGRATAGARARPGTAGGAVVPAARPAVVRRVRSAGTGPADIGGFPAGSGTGPAAAFTGVSPVRLLSTVVRPTVLGPVAPPRVTAGPVVGASAVVPARRARAVRGTPLGPVRTGADGRDGGGTGTGPRPR
ncbi:DMT family transporter [Streptomyces pactum]|uniref:DMT family transporter n=1 Tax=Streptomyces pactum TaxID=68249 RepID=A0ABS0NEK3_9ACTN|nr:DMT family transporter [Streptomyces pactum]MBH5333596.1 DMT family transporter [Streptomyces pactum]